jgi:hypothetical protein
VLPARRCHPHKHADPTLLYLFLFRFLFLFVSFPFSFPFLSLFLISDICVLWGLAGVSQRSYQQRQLTLQYGQCPLKVSASVKHGVFVLCVSCVGIGVY